MAATLLLLGSAYYAIREGLDEAGAALLSAGLVTLGAWIVEEVSGRDD